jgi:phage FluMu protein gp41
MNENIIVMTDRLNQVLVEENGWLDALDLQAAVALLARKRDAVAALQGALSLGSGTAKLSPESSEALRTSVRRLAELGEANRAAIERGLALQMQLIQTIAQAVPRGRAAEAPVYQPDGTQVPSRPLDAFAFLSRM